MPGTATHNWILYRTLREFGAASALTKEVQKSHDAVRDWAQKAAAERGDGADELDRFHLAGCAYVGACGPDLFYLDLGSTGTVIADLLHYNRSGPYMIWCLRRVKQQLEAVEAGLNTNLLRQYAYCLGHISHIAADIVIHPYVNSIVGAYPDQSKDFRNARGKLLKNLWKFHNILEHHQDSYVLHRLFFGQEKFSRESWENANVARWASRFFLQDGNSSQYFFVQNSRGYYRYAKAYGANLETDKYKFFASNNWFLNLDTYYDATIPDEATMNSRPGLVQGGTFAQDGTRQTSGLFDSYLDDAVAMAKRLWDEVEVYLASTAKGEDLADPKPDDLEDLDKKMSQAKKHFPMLRRHWNLDCGLAPVGDDYPKSWALPNLPDHSLGIAGGISFVSSHARAKPDVA